MDDCYDSPLSIVPAAYRKAAEEIRDHLITLRGQGIFLSPADALLIIDWLDAEVSVSDIFCALERAVLARQKRPSRIPLRLGHAKRHLGKSMPPMNQGSHEPTPTKTGSHPLQRWGILIQEDADSEEEHRQLRLLAQEVLSLPVGEEESMIRGAQTCCRRFLNSVYESLPPTDMRALMAQKQERLGSLVDSLDEGTLNLLLQEGVRNSLRARYPLLSTDILWQLVSSPSEQDS